MNPAMVVTLLLGGLLLWANTDLLHQHWMHAKLTLVILMVGFHHGLSRWRKAFVKDANRHSAKFYRRINEVPTVLMIGIIILVIVKPF